MQNQFEQQKQDIINAKASLKKFKNDYDKIIKFGYNIDHLNNLHFEIEKIQYPIQMITKMVNLDSEIMIQALTINDEINNIKANLDDKKKELEKNHINPKPIQSNIYPLNQQDDITITILKRENQQMQGQIKTLEENQIIQNNKIQQLTNSLDMVIKQNTNLSNQVQQLNNYIIQIKNQIGDNNLQINRVDNQIQQIQQNIKNNNQFAYSDAQLQNSQVIMGLQYKYEQINNEQKNVKQELARITQYYSVQHSQEMNV